MDNLQPFTSYARVYTDINRSKPESFFEHECFKPKFDDLENYQLLQKIGQGKFSVVFEGINENNNDHHVIIKILKPVKKSKINREIKILDILKNGANIVNLLSVVNIPVSDQMALIFNSEMSTLDAKECYLSWNASDTRYYTMEILKALDYCHSHGIMHRDVKPHNIIVNENRRKLKLIDFGLAEFYRPGERYNVRVASRYYKGPELLVEYPYYDYSLDLWSLGCIFAAMIFRKEPFFQGYNNENQLYCIVKVLGTKGFSTYLTRYNIHYFGMKGTEKYDNWSRKSWERFISTENEHLIDYDTLDFLDGLLCYDHMQRMTAREAMEHNYFRKIYQ